MVESPSRPLKSDKSLHWVTEKSPPTLVSETRLEKLDNLSLSCANEEEQTSEEQRGKEGERTEQEKKKGGGERGRKKSIRVARIMVSVEMKILLPACGARVKVREITASSDTEKR